MLARKFGSAWETLAPAKLNLYLEVLGRRPDGFHEVETLMAPVRIYDRLRWEPGEGQRRPSSLHYDPATPAAYQAVAPADDGNLVTRALHALGESAGLEPWGRITLAKRIPPQAGLGGGSSDAAAALVLANRAWRIHYPVSRLVEAAASLGSDVPFFLAGQSAICRGRGEQVEPVDGMPRLDVVVVKPPFGLATAAVYQALDAGPVQPAPAESRLMAARLCDRLRSGRLVRIGEAMGNRLQAAAARLCEWFEQIGQCSIGCHASAIK